MDAHAAGHVSARAALDRRLEGVGWALFLIMVGGIGLIQTVPQGTWLIGTGLIMLGLNAARYANGSRMSNFTLVLGVVALVLGVGAMTGVEFSVFPILLIIVGADILVGRAGRTARG
jgi:hypothetical protein